MRRRRQAERGARSTTPCCGKVVEFRGDGQHLVLCSCGIFYDAYVAKGVVQFKRNDPVSLPAPESSS